MPKRSSKPTKDVNQLAASILAQVTQEAEDQPAKNPAAVALGRLGGLKGGKASAAALKSASGSASPTKSTFQRLSSNGRT